MFCKSVKSSKYWGALVLAGVLTLIFSIIAYQGIANDAPNVSMLKGMFFGLGTAFTVIGSVKLIQNRKTPAEKLKAQEIALKDERNIQILRIAYSIASTVATILFGIMAFIFVGLNFIIPAFISLGAMYIQLLVFFIAYKYYNRKM